MADLQKMDRTWLCSVLFMDIVNYSSQSVDIQMKWKTRFNNYLTEAIRDVPESERVILDTGDGAAVCFLGAPEAAMFAALHLWQCFVKDEREQQPGLRVRTGVNLGPVKLLKDINGNLNVIGDGINDGQRIMSFARENQILVSQSFFQVVSCLSDDYKALFRLKGVETDKHVREHTVYSLLPPGAGKPQDELAVQAPPPEPAISHETTAAPPRPRATAPEPSKRRIAPLVVGGVLIICVAAVAIWRFAGSGTAKTTSSPSIDPDYDQGMALVEQARPAEAIVRFDKSIKANPNSAYAYLGRAEAHRMLHQFEVSIEDCNHAMQINSEDPRVYLCRGLGEAGQKQFDSAMRDYGEAIRRNPNFAVAYESRGNANIALQQYDRALEDFTQAIRVKPKDAQFYLRRATVYENLKQYEKAIQDCDQAIRLQPNNARAYLERANAKRLSGDGRGAEADRLQARQLKEQ